MAQKLNKKLVGILIVSIMTLMTVAAVVLVNNLPTPDPTKYAKDGEKYFAEGDYDRAIQAFQRAFSKDPAQNPEYLVRAARCAIELGDPVKARNCIQFAKVRDANNKATLEMDLDVEFELAPYVGSINHWNGVIERAKNMLDMDEFAQSARVHCVLGSAYLSGVMRKEDPTYESKGTAELKRAIELDPTNVEALTTLAEQMSRVAMEKDANRSMAEARDIRAARLGMIRTAIEKCGDSDAEKKTELETLLARFMIVDGEIEEGIKILEAQARAETSRVDARLMLGRLYSGVFSVRVDPDLEKSAGYLRSAIESEPSKPQPYLALGRVLKIQRDESTDPAVKEAKLRELRELYDQGLNKIDRSKHFRKLANNQARVQMVEELFLQELAISRDAATADEKKQSLARAEQLIERLKEERSAESLEVHFTTAHLYSARGDIIEATREAEAALATQNGQNNPAVMRLCADLYTRQGQWGAGRDMLMNLIRLERNDPALYIGLARVLVQLNQPTEALAALQPAEPASVRTALEQDPNAIRVRVEAYRQLKDFDRATAESRKLGEGTVDDVVREAGLLVAEGQYAEAERKLTPILEKDPTNESAVRTLLQVYESSGRREEGRTYIDQLAAEYPDNRRLKQLQIAMISDLSEAERDQKIFEFINEEKDDLTRYTALVGYYERKGEIEKAMGALDQAEKLSPDSGTIIEGQFTLALRKKDWARAASYAKRSGDLNSDGTHGKMCEGRLALAKAGDARAAGRNDEARQLIDQAIGLMKIALDNYPQNSQGWTYLAGAYIDSGRIEEAKDVLQRALSINPANGYASMFLARIAASEGNEPLERRYLADASRALPEDTWIAERLRYYNEKDNPSSGIEVREKIAREKPDDLENWIRLARLYADPKVAANDKAAEAYRKAMELTDDKLPLAAEFADFFASESVNRPAEGDALLKGMFDAEEDKAKKALIAASLGRFFERQHTLATADRHYRQAAFLDPSPRVLNIVAEFFARTGKYKEAIEQFEKLLPLVEDDPKAVAETQSRMIAILLTTGDLPRAKSMIDAYVERFPDDPQGLILVGTYHLIGGDIEKAMDALNRHLARDPDNAVALWQRGKLHLLRGRWQSAIEDLRKSKAFKPDAFNYQHRIALADALIEAGRSDEAISELQQILDVNPDEADVAEGLIDALTRVRPPRFAEAENLIYRYQARFSRDARWPTLLGRLGELAQDWNKSMTGYEKAAELNGYQPETIRLLFSAFRSAGKPERIIQYATDKLSSNLMNRIPEALSILAWAYDQTGQSEKCYESFDRALLATGGNFHAYVYVIADIVTVLGKESALSRALEQSRANPSDTERLKALVHLYKINDRTTEAIETCDEVLQKASTDADLIFAHLAKGMLLTSAEQYEAARSSYEEVLKLNPEQGMTLNNLAYLLYAQLNKPEEALVYSKKAAQIQPNNPDVLDTYGRNLALLRRYGEAAGTLLRALELDKNNIDVIYHLAELYRDKGDGEEAVLMYERALKLLDDLRQDPRGYKPKIKEALEKLGHAGR